MNINATLFIQIINFGLAWIFIRNLLVVPAMRVSMQKKASFDDLTLRRDLLKKTIETTQDKAYS